MKNGVDEEFKRWLQFFEQFDNCSITDMKNKDGRMMITSLTPVPWSRSLRQQYNEPPNKIGYIFPQKNGVKLVIDFPHNTFSRKTIQSIIDPEGRILYIPIDKRASAFVSWWRFRSSRFSFDSLHLVIRSHYFSKIDLSKKEIIEFFEKIIHLANQSN